MIEFRPHHFLCTLGFEGKGYSEAFVREFQRIADELRKTSEGDETPIRVVVGVTDSICEPCPNRQGRMCATQEKIVEIDRRHAEVLDLRDGDVLTWGEAKRRIAERVDLAVFDRICEPCGWKPLGVCRKALQSLAGGWFAIALAAGVLLMMGSSPAESTPKRRAPTPPKPFEFPALPDTKATIDEVFARLSQTKKSPYARAIRRAAEAIEAGKWATVREHSKFIRKSSLFPDYAHFFEAQANLGEAEERLRRGKAAAAAIGLAKKAFDGFHVIFKNYPDSVLLNHFQVDVGLTEVVLGEAHFAKKSYKAALSYYESGFERLFTEIQYRRIRGDTIANYATACQKIRSETCVLWVQRIARALPNPSLERTKLMERLPEVKDLPSYPNYAGNGSRLFRDEEKDLKAFNEAMQLYLKGDYDDAAERFRALLTEFPNSSHETRATFWLARSLEKDGEEEEARKHYEWILATAPLTYYGILASFSSGKPLEAYVDATLPEAWTRDPSLFPDEHKKLERAEYLLVADARDQAAEELSVFKASSRYSSPFLMYLVGLCDQSGNHLTKFSILSELFRRKYSRINSTYVVRMIFPIVHRNLIQKYAAENRVDAILLLSLMKQESAFRHKIISRSGAVGLMQLMPFTAVDTDKTVEQHQLLDPEVNVRLGSAYLARVLRRFNGNIALSLAGYNAGPTRSARWKADSDPKWSLAEFVETIPYKETRDYVSGIVRNYFWYSYQINGKRLTSFDYFWGVSGPLEMPTDVVNHSPYSGIPKETN